MDTKEITLDEVYAKKAEFRKIGMARFSINGLDEDESIRRLIAESWSVFFIAVRDPYLRGGQSGSFRFRIFQTLKHEPQIPMGYSGMPMFGFECHEGKPVHKALEILRGKLKKEYTHKIDGDLLTLYPVKSEENKIKAAVKVIPYSDAQEGDECFANWSNCYKQFKGRCRVIRRNARTYRVELLEDIINPDPTSTYSGHSYKTGRELVIPINGTKQNCLTIA